MDLKNNIQPSLGDGGLSVSRGEGDLRVKGGATLAASATNCAAQGCLGKMSGVDHFGKTAPEVSGRSESVAGPEAAYRGHLQGALRSQAAGEVRQEILDREGGVIKKELGDELRAQFMKENGF